MAPEHVVTSSKEYFNEEAKSVSSKEKSLQDIPESEKDMIIRECPYIESVIEAKGVIWRSQRYYTGCAVVIDGNHTFKFAEIEKAYFIDGVPFVYCQILDVVSFNPHFHAYEVKKADSFRMVNLRNLYDYHPLGIYTLHKSCFIPMRHHIS